MIKYSDFNYTSNKQNWKLILKHIYMLEDESMSWINQKQKFVVIFITEMKYMIMSMFTKIEIWLVQMLRNINMSKYFEINLHHVSIQKNEAHQVILFIQLKENNQVVLILIKNVYVHKQLKHINVFYHNIYNLHKQNQIQINFVLN